MVEHRATEHPATEDQATEPARPTSRRPITRTATEARQGEIILGKRGRWLWIATFVVLMLFAIYGFWM